MVSLGFVPGGVSFLLLLCGFGLCWVFFVLFCLGFFDLFLLWLVGLGFVCVFFGFLFGWLLFFCLFVLCLFWFFSFPAEHKCPVDQREQLEETLPLILGLILGLVIVITLCVYHIHHKLTANQVQIPRDRSQYKHMG